MSDSNTNGWFWSPPHQDYYYTSIGQNGETLYHFSKQQSQASTTQVGSTNDQIPYTEPVIHRRNDSVSIQYPHMMPPPAPTEIRNRVDFPGTPDRGWTETLDPSYHMRTRDEAKKFFVQGRVFSMLWSETAGGNTNFRRKSTINTSITIGKFGQGIHSQIRRFVIIKVNREKHFVYACAISTYRDQGVNKPGCHAYEHTAVYLTGSKPQLLKGERERGMDKEPIEIKPTSNNVKMKSTSRLRFGRTYSIEWNVKVKDIGMVAKKHMPKLLLYHKEEDEKGFDLDADYVNDDDEDDEEDGEEGDEDEDGEQEGIHQATASAMPADTYSTAERYTHATSYSYYQQ